MVEFKIFRNFYGTNKDEYFFNTTVNEWLKTNEGYKPHGSIIIDKNQYLYQTFVKYDDSINQSQGGKKNKKQQTIKNKKNKFRRSVKRK